MRRLLIIGLAAFGISEVAYAQSLDRRAEQERYCTGDAFRLCGSEIPDEARITACMVRLRRYLSPECNAVFDDEPSPAASSGRAQRRPTQLAPR